MNISLHYSNKYLKTNCFPHILKIFSVNASLSERFPKKSYRFHSNTTETLQKGIRLSFSSISCRLTVSNISLKVAAHLWPDLIIISSAGSPNQKGTGTKIAGSLSLLPSAPPHPRYYLKSSLQVSSPRRKPSLSILHASLF